MWHKLSATTYGMENSIDALQSFLILNVHPVVSFVVKLQFAVATNIFT